MFTERQLVWAVYGKSAAPNVYWWPAIVDKTDPFTVMWPNLQTSQYSMRKCLPYFMFKDTVLDRIRSRGALTDFKSTHIKWIEAKETAALRDMEKAHKSTNELFVMFKGNPAKGVNTLPRKAGESTPNRSRSSSAASVSRNMPTTPTVPQESADVKTTKETATKEVKRKGPGRPARKTPPVIEPIEKTKPGTGDKRRGKRRHSPANQGGSSGTDKKEVLAIQSRENRTPTQSSARSSNGDRLEVGQIQAAVFFDPPATSVMRPRRRATPTTTPITDNKTVLPTSPVLMPPPSSVKPVDPDFKDLNEQQTDALGHAWDDKLPSGEVLSKAFNLSVSRKDLLSLRAGKWLNDEVINFYMELIVNRAKTTKGENGKPWPTVYTYNTFMYSTLMTAGYKQIARCTRKVDIFSFDLLLVPVHLGMHWCLAVIDMRNRLIRYFDSMSGDNTSGMEALKLYLADEHMDKKKTELNMETWSIIQEEIPQQYNGYDCGMFACKFADFVSRGKRITFAQAHMDYFRKRAVVEIMNSKLMS